MPKHDSRWNSLLQPKVIFQADPWARYNRRPCRVVWHLYSQMICSYLQQKKIFKFISYGKSLDWRASNLKTKRMTQLDKNQYWNKAINYFFGYSLNMLLL